MIRRDEPTPAIHAESLKNALINASLYDVDDPDMSISDLLADIMHLIDAEECDSFESQCERAEQHYTAEVEELKQRQKGRRA
jgi:hypothetical protein